MSNADGPDMAAYEFEPYRRDLQTEIIATQAEGDRLWVRLADTILYPEGGGQPADHGTIGAAAVFDVQTRDGRVWHAVTGDIAATLAPGPVTVELDWSRRYDHMQQHTAQHLLSALAEDRFGWTTTSFHLGVERSDIELDAAQIGPDELLSLEEQVAEAIRAAHAVTPRRVRVEDLAALSVRSRGLPAGHSGDIRLVEIANCDLNTCGGTHLRSTAEIESLHLISNERMRGGTRVHFVAGRRARQRMRRHEDRLSDLRQLVDATDDTIAAAVGARVAQIEKLNKREKFLEGELAQSVARTLASHAERVVVAHFANHRAEFLRAIAQILPEQTPLKIVLLTAGIDGDGAFALVAGRDTGLDLGKVGPAIAQILEGRGGGKGTLFQGKANAVRNAPQAQALLMAQIASS